MRLGFLTAAAFALIAMPVAAAEELPPEIDMLLWCGHAFTLVGEQAGLADPEQGKTITALGAALKQQGREQLIANKVSEPDVLAAEAATGALVESQLAAPDGAKYTVDQCRALVTAQ